MKHKIIDVCAVVVTYNRKEWLIECIEAIKKQTVTVSRILIINNDSSDGTREWLDDQLDLEVVHQGNVGGAGGFETGIQRAYEQGHKWIWCLDDDVEPVLDGLEKMLKHSNTSQCINTNKIGVGGEIIKLGGFMNLLSTNRRPFKEKNISPRPEWSEFEGACFEGMLIHRDIVTSIGYPIGEMFIGGDDTLYGLLASLYTKVILLEDPVIVKKKSLGCKNKLFFGSVTIHSDFYLYHVIRNSFIVKNALIVCFNRRQAEYIKTILIYSAKAMVRSIFIKEISYKQVWIIAKAIVDGFEISKKYNKDYFKKFKI